MLGVVAVVVVLVLVRMGAALQFVGPWRCALGGSSAARSATCSIDVFRSGSGRFLGGYVIDFIDVQWWPVFNVADMAIVFGALASLVVDPR